MDQADSLRKLAKSQGRNIVDTFPDNKSNKTKTIAITSGKGGVGKSNIALNMGISIAKNYKKKIFILDADFGTANVDILMGVFPKYNIANVIFDQITIENVLVEGPYGIKVLPGVSGVSQLTSLTESQKHFFFEQLELYQDANHPDVIIIDTGAGVGMGVINFLMAADEVIVVVTQEPTSLSDSYALIKTLHKYKPEAKVSIVINLVNNESEALRIYNVLHNVCSKFMDKDIEYLGYVSTSKTIVASVKEQRPFIINYPSCNASLDINRLATKVMNSESHDEKGLKNFFYLATKYFGWND
jgi:flagellar biosynthesis protein FlhG